MNELNEFAKHSSSQFALSTRSVQPRPAFHLYFTNEITHMLSIGSSLRYSGDGQIVPKTTKYIAVMHMANDRLKISDGCSS